MSARPIIAVTLGDPNGIGPEVVLKAASHLASRKEVRVVITGPKSVFEFYRRFGAGVDHPFTVLEPNLEQEIIPEPGKMTKAGGLVAGRSLDFAIDLVLNREADALVTAPVSKEALNAAGYDFPGQTEFLANRCHSKNYLMMLLSDNFRVGVVTTHCPISKVAGLLSTELILTKLRILHHDLQDRFGIQAPRIAVTGLNPHAGEGGLFGNEEIAMITPAVERARDEGIGVSGPLPADSLFARIEQQRYDAYLAMYHDQGLIPLKMKSFGRAVNYTAGLPLLRTSPDHGTAFDIAGRGTADSGSMEEAIKLAAALAKNRN